MRERAHEVCGLYLTSSSCRSFDKFALRVKLIFPEQLKMAFKAQNPRENMWLLGYIGQHLDSLVMAEVKYPNNFNKGPNCDGKMGSEILINCMLAII